MTVFDPNNLLSLGAPVLTLLFPAKMPAAKKVPLSMSRLWSHLIYMTTSYYAAIFSLHIAGFRD